MMKWNESTFCFVHIMENLELNEGKAGVRCEHPTHTHTHLHADVGSHSNSNGSS
jgi:hypothetical protein